MLITSDKSIYVAKQSSMSVYVSLPENQMFLLLTYMLFQPVLWWGGILSMFSSLFYFFSISTTLWHGSVEAGWSPHRFLWFLCTCLYLAILHGFQRTSFSELIQTSQLLPRGGLQPCENYFGFAGRRSWQPFPSNSLSLAALNKVMEIFISSQTWNTDSIYKCQDCSENKVHTDFHKFHSRFFLHQPICKQIMC